MAKSPDKFGQNWGIRNTDMKILWIAKHDKPDSDHQCDHLFHGLRTILGPDIVDVVRADRAYTSSFGEGKLFPLSELSFTFGGLLPDIEVDREDIPHKIKSCYFDYVFYGSIHRDKSYLPEVLSTYIPSRIVFIDGEDDQFFAPQLGQGFYFKRELAAPEPRAFPIQFAIPKEKIVRDIPSKKYLMCPASPSAMDSSGVRIFTDESKYYRLYGQSYFAETKKKGGWDCLRHYEIIAAGSLPYFKELENCPATTMTLLPKKELLVARDLCDDWAVLSSKEHMWDNLASRVRGILEEHLTTEALAKRVLDTVTK